MSTGLRRLVAMTLATAVMLTLVWLTVTMVEANAQVANTCKDLGFPDNLEADTSGAWGSVDFSNTEDTLTLVVNAGYEVTLCVKAGSANQGNGPETAGPFSVGTHIVGHTSGKDLSHYGLTFQTVTTTTGEVTTTPPTITTPTTAPTTTTVTTPTTSVESSTTTTSTTLPASTTTTTEGATTTTASGSSTTSSTLPTGTTDPTVTTVPGVPPSTLPFTGVGEGTGFLALIGAVALLSGVGMVAWKGREE